MTLSDSELERYARQLVLDDWGGERQERLRAASAIVVGAGALGSVAAGYLVAAGVGRVGIVDDDAVELSNLHRQPAFVAGELGTPKAETLSARLGLLNEEIVVEPYPVRLGADNAGAIVAGADVVVDCTDSFAARYLVNAACCAERVDLVEAGIGALEGLVMSIRPGRSACYECVFPTSPAEDQTCAETGILGPVAGIVGSIQALEAIKLLSGLGTPLVDRVLQIDADDMSQLAVSTRRRFDCSACGEGISTQSSEV